METIQDLHNYIQSRKRKGKTARQIASDLGNHGYDQHAARALTMMHWWDDDEEANED